MSERGSLFSAEDAGPVAEAVKRLALALRARRMYPASSPMLTSALERAAEALNAASGGRRLSLVVRPRELTWTDPGGEERTAREEELARRLHLHGISHLTIARSVDAGAIAALLDAVLLDREELEGAHPLIAGQIPGFEVEALELQHLFNEGGEELDTETVWDRVIQGFSGGTSWSALGGDPRQLAAMLEWSMDPETQPEALSAYSQTDVFGLICEQVAIASEEDPEVTVQTILRAVASLFSKIDREAWLEILSDPLPVTLGSGDRAVEVDLTSVIARALSAGQIEEIAGYAVNSRRAGTPRLYRFFQTAIGERDDQAMIANRILSSNPATQTRSFEEAFPGFLQALTGEDASPYVNNDYQTSLDDALSRIPATPLWPAEILRKRAGELSARYTRLAMARVTHALVCREGSDEYYPRMMAALASRLEAVVESANPDLLEAITSTIVRHADDPSRSQIQREAAQEALAHLREPDFIRRVVKLMQESDETRFHALWRVVDHLGPACLPFVLDSMADSPTPAYRGHLARILQQLDELPVDLLSERLCDERAAFVRDLVAVVAEVGGNQVVALLEQALEHGDAGVRRAALVGLARYPAAVSESYFIQALSDPALEVRVAALRGFRGLYADESQGRLLAYLRLPNWTGRNTRVIAAAAKALARVGDVAALADLRRLSRRPWLFRRRRIAVATAAAAAHQAIEQRLLSQSDTEVTAGDHRTESDESRREAAA